MNEPGGFLAAPQTVDAFLKGGRRAARPAHARNVAAGAEGAALAGENDHADIGVGRQPRYFFLETGSDLGGQRVQLLGTVERQQGDAILDIDPELRLGGGLHLGYGHSGSSWFLTFEGRAGV